VKIGEELDSRLERSVEEEDERNNEKRKSRHRE
jgi:hypothetical protein